jgi:aldose 1-epimerase
MSTRLPTFIGTRHANRPADEQLTFGRVTIITGCSTTAPVSLALAAKAYEPVSGRLIEVLTTEPGLQFLQRELFGWHHIGKPGQVYKRRYGFCLETQHFPDLPNKPRFRQISEAG